MGILEHTFPPNLAGIYDEKLSNQLAKTQGAVVSLNQSRRLLHNPNLLMNPILRKEAEASSRLEGTQASIEDIYKLGIEDQSEEKIQDISEIKNYEKAMNVGIEIIKKMGSLNNLTIRDIHKTLMQGVRGENKNPGEFRMDRVWIGSKGTNEKDARYIPPDAVNVSSLMEQLVRYIEESKIKDVNPLIACGVIHHRFEAIHPFKDGNGRTGRLLISLYLIYRELLSVPMLYASGYFESNRKAYMDALSEVDHNENWYEWLYYFLVGIEKQAIKSLELAFTINDMYKDAENKIKGLASHVALLQALEQCFVHLIITAPMLSAETSIPISSARRYLKELSDQQVIQDIGKRRTQRVYVNVKLIELLKNI